LLNQLLFVARLPMPELQYGGKKRLLTAIFRLFTSCKLQFALNITLCTHRIRSLTICQYILYVFPSKCGNEQLFVFHFIDIVQVSFHSVYKMHILHSPLFYVIFYIETIHI